MIITVVAQLDFRFPLACFFSTHTARNAAGVWWSFPITDVGAALVAAGWFAQGRWKKTRVTDEDTDIARVADETILKDGSR
jgi:Na+-driven multidrug efflux pump